MPPIEQGRLNVATWTNEGVSITTNTSTYTGNATVLPVGLYTVCCTTATLFKQGTENVSVTVPNYAPADVPFTVEVTAAANGFLECKALASAGTVYIMQPI